MANRFHRHGVDELLMELRVAFAWRQAVLRCDLLVARSTGSYQRVAGRVEVHHFDVLADRPRLEGLERDAVHDLVDAGGVQTGGKARIERIAAQVPVGWSARRQAQMITYA